MRDDRSKSSDVIVVCFICSYSPAEHFLQGSCGWKSMAYCKGHFPAGWKDPPFMYKNISKAEYIEQLVVSEVMET